METACAIGMKQPDGSVRAIRCNFDGYVGYVGAILAIRYNTANKVKSLLDLGELRFVAETLEECEAHYRDRSEAFRPPLLYTTLSEYQNAAFSQLGVHYLYLYDANEWFIYGLPTIEEWIKITSGRK